MTLSALAGFELPLRHAWNHQKSMKPETSSDNAVNRSRKAPPSKGCSAVKTTSASTERSKENLLPRPFGHRKLRSNQRLCVMRSLRDRGEMEGTSSSRNSSF